LKTRARIKDIAKELNLSSSTVSRALANNTRISQHVRDEVAALAKRWGYTRNPFAINLYQNRSNSIGLILPEFTHHYFSQTLKGVDQVVKEKGYNLIVNSHNDDFEKEVKATQLLNDSLVEGILVSCSGNYEGLEHFREVILSGIPIVFFDRLCEDMDVSYVITDDFNGAIAAIDHMALTGCKKVAYFGGPENLSTNFNRHMGYHEGLKKNGLSFSKNLILPWQTNLEKWKVAVSSFLSSHNVDGIFCFSDYIAYDALEILERMNVKVPDEISVIGFSDEPISYFTRPKISTVSQPAELVGRRAAEILLWHLENPDIKKVITEQLPTRLILRETTKTKG
jgi:DNA-binding LacI/PurR family transcriptional regulator